MNAKQLELELELALEDAAEMPVLADLQSLWQQVEPLLRHLSTQEQLRLGGTVIDQLAELHRVKAERLLEDWENTFNPQDPFSPCRLVARAGKADAACGCFKVDGSCPTTTPRFLL